MKTHIENVNRKIEAGIPFIYFTVVLRDDADRFTYAGIETRIQESSISQANVQAVVQNAIDQATSSADPLQRLIYIIREKLKL